MLRMQRHGSRYFGSRIKAQACSANTIIIGSRISMSFPQETSLTKGRVINSSVNVLLAVANGE